MKVVNIMFFSCCVGAKNLSPVDSYGRKIFRPYISECYINYY